jgi:hypothetical protein
MPKQHVLGEGYIWFTKSPRNKLCAGYDGLHLVTEANGGDPVKFNINRDNLGAWQKVRIVAIPLSDKKKAKKK